MICAKKQSNSHARKNFSVFSPNFEKNSQFLNILLILADAYDIIKTDIRP